MRDGRLPTVHYGRLPTVHEVEYLDARGSSADSSAQAGYSRTASIGQ